MDSSHHVLEVLGEKFNLPTKYSLISPIGHSGARGIIAALDKDTGNKVAINKITRDYITGEYVTGEYNDGKNILREITFMRKFQHKNILCMIDILTVDNFDEIYYVQELMETDLQRVIDSKQQLTIDHIQYFIYQILRGLKYIHSANVMHRDLKPTSLLLNANCDLKIFKFESARMDQVDLADYFTPAVTTRWYRAPELLLGCRDYTKAIDMWSVGCIFAELLARKPFFPERDNVSILRLICDKLGKPSTDDLGFVASKKARNFISSLPEKEPLPQLVDHFPAYKDELKALDLLKKMLNFQPTQRISATDALAHPFLASISDVNDEPNADFTFFFEYENCELSFELLRELVSDEVKRYHPHIHESPPDSTYNTSKAVPSIDDTVLPPVRLIPFDAFKKLGQLPRCPENKDLLVNYEDTIRDESLYIFMSHCWLRGWSGAPGWDRRPHPDTSNHDKYQLMVAAVEKIMKSLTTMSKCYIWLDFGCIDQDAAACDELKMLDKIVGVCDLILTNVHDTQDWDMPTTVNNWFEDYKSPAWNGSDYAYLNRGWCRVEMLYAANIPLESDNAARADRFKAGLLGSVRERRRPHLLYGTHEHKLGHSNPIHLPPMQNSWFDEYNPVDGKLSKTSDHVKIQQLVADIAPRVKKLKAGYFGESNRGTLRYANGDVYKGEFKDGVRNGFGKFRHSDGNYYEGEYRDDKRHGKGVYQYADGSVYEGEYQDGKRHGYGRQQRADGSLAYEGKWENDKPATM